MAALLRVRNISKLHRDHARWLPKATMASMLHRYGRDLTEQASSSRDPVVGRDDEINRVVSILSRKSKNSAVLVGAPGVGKTAIAEGLAQRLAAGRVPGVLAGARLVELSLPSMLSGASYLGSFEKRVTGVIREAEDAGHGKVVLFMDEIHTLVGAGSYKGSKQDAADMLKPALARGRIRCLGATTHDEYQRHFASDKALERRFQKVDVAEPSEDGTLAILRRLTASYQKHHGMNIRDDALVAAVRLSGRYVSERHFPDKAIDLVDEACATARLQLELRASRGGRSETIQDQTIGPDHVAQVLSKWTGIPVTRLGQDDQKRLQELPTKLHRRVVGQDEAISAVVDTVMRSRSGLSNPKQPSGSFLFLGPTGVGKTELAKALAEQLFGDEKHLVRIDMSEYVDSGSVARLIGAPPGTVGYENGGHLTEQVMRRPYSVVLFDEVEKGHDAVFNLFLQILDDGRLTDAKGRTVDFTNTIIIMTSNLGARHLLHAAGALVGDDARLQRVMADVQMRFRPELINRLDEMVVFRPLSGETLRKVVRLQLGAIAARLANRGVGLEVADAAVDVVLSNCSGQVPTYGARPIKRCLQNMVTTRISRMMVDDEVDDGCNISIDGDGKELRFNVDKPEKIIEASPSPASEHEDCDMSVDADDDDANMPNEDETESSPPFVKDKAKPTTSSVKEDIASMITLGTFSLMLAYLTSHVKV